jgi:hypothetical protein
VRNALVPALLLSGLCLAYLASGQDAGPPKQGGGPFPAKEGQEPVLRKDGTNPSPTKAGRGAAVEREGANPSPAKSKKEDPSPAKRVARDPFTAPTVLAAASKVQARSAPLTPKLSLPPLRVLGFLRLRPKPGAAAVSGALLAVGQERLVVRVKDVLRGVVEQRAYALEVTAMAGGVLTLRLPSGHTLELR